MRFAVAVFILGANADADFNLIKHEREPVASEISLKVPASPRLRIPSRALPGSLCLGLLEGARDAQKEALVCSASPEVYHLQPRFSLVPVELIFTAHDRSCFQPLKRKWRGLVLLTQTANCSVAFRAFEVCYLTVLMAF